MLHFNKKNITCTIAYALLIITTSWAEVPKEIIDVAQNGLPHLFGRVQEHKPELYGFPLDSRQEDLVLGAPFQLYTISPSNLLEKAENTPVKELISKTSIWYFPILVDDKPCALLCVDLVNNSWKAVSLGYSNLAKQVDMIRTQWSESKGYHPVIIAVFQARQHLFNIPEHSTDNLTYISAPKPRFQVHEKRMQADIPSVDYSTLSNPTNVILELRPIVSASSMSKDLTP